MARALTQMLAVSTASGDFSIQLHHEAAPATCVYFSELVEAGCLDGSSVFRIVTPTNEGENDLPIQIVQLGLCALEPEDRTFVPHEDTRETGLAHRQWTVSAARFDAGELYGSFFVCLRDEPGLDFGGERNPDGRGFAAFGEVVAGFDTLWRLYEHAEAKPMLDEPVEVLTVRRVVGEDAE